jgi:hypothetical protein
MASASVSGVGSPPASTERTPCSSVFDPASNGIFACSPARAISVSVFERKYPSIAVLKRMPCAFAAASWSCCAGMARSAARESAPAAAANFSPFCSASASGRGGKLAIAAPLSQIAPAIKSLESGEAISALTEIEPADSPAMVTRFGSPPNAAMFCCTHRSAATWSSRP